jgi:hypothetical protein
MHKIICICNHGPTSDPHRPLHCRGRLVLTSYYKIERQKVADSLAKLLLKAGVQCASLEPVLDALARFKATNCDFFDCYLAAQAASSGVAIASFDNDLRKFIVIPANCKRARNETGCLCVREDARSQISTTLLAAREKRTLR